ncbi:MAG: flavin reductase family protein [Burkholderiales bacterium]
MTNHAIDPRALRRALGSFVTGVTVVTTRSHDGELAGLTVNSFSSVSLSPPLVLWSLALTAVSFEIFERASHFAVNILAEDQIHISERFATSGGDKFAGVKVREGLAGVPLLEDVAASFICRNTFRYPGGDHIILVGEVISYDQTEREPLLYSRGRYMGTGERLDQRHEKESFMIRVLQKKIL